MRVRYWIKVDGSEQINGLIRSLTFMDRPFKSAVSWYESSSDAEPSSIAYEVELSKYELLYIRLTSVVEISKSSNEKDIDPGRTST